MILREMFIPKCRIPIKSHRERNFLIRVFNDKVNLYESVYTYTDVIDISHVNIDKIFLDFDCDEKFIFFDNVRTVARYLYEKDIKFYIRFSGRGFHIFILLDNEWLEYPKIAIKQYVKALHKETNTESDPAVVADLRRVVRIPYTINKRNNLYCIPLSYNDLMTKTYEEICKMAEEPMFFTEFINGNKLLNIKDFDKIPAAISEHYITTKKTTISNKIPPCIKALMEDPYTLYDGRFRIILFFRELGYLKEEVEKILENCLCEEYFEHCIQEEKQVEYLFNREELFFPSCKTMKLDGYCPDNDCEGHGLYY